MNYNEYNELTELIKNRVCKVFNKLDDSNSTIKHIVIEEITDKIYSCIIFTDNVDMYFDIPLEIIELNNDDFEDFLNNVHYEL